MTSRYLRHALLFGALFMPAAARAQGSALQGDQSSPDTSSIAGAPVPAALTAEQLDTLVAPIALYPDALVAQLLGAATYPDQVVIAQQWLTENKGVGLTPPEVARAVDQQPWDASVKALIQFPNVLADLAGNLAWTSNLGQAFHYQQADVMAAVQAMRAKAQAAGTLVSTPQLSVSRQDSAIVIQPTDTQIVYVPQYNPTVIYGTRYVVPYYNPAIVYAAPGITFGIGYAVGPGYWGGGWGWGWHAWHANWGWGWGGGTVVYNHYTYISNNTWHGGSYNGYHPWGPGPHGPGPYGPHPYYPNGGHNGDHGMIGGNGGVDHGPNGGRNGDHGLIGGNGGTQHDGFSSFNNDRSRSQMGGDGAASHAESNRGRYSMGGGNHGGGGIHGGGHMGGGGGHMGGGGAHMGGGGGHGGGGGGGHGGGGGRR